MNLIGWINPNTQAPLHNYLKILLLFSQNFFEPGNNNTFAIYKILEWSNTQN